MAAPLRAALRVLVLALAVAGTSCSTLHSRIQHPHAQPLDAALRSAQTDWQSLPAQGHSSTIERTRWRLDLGGVLLALQHRNRPQTWTGTQSIQGWTITFAGDADGLKSIPPSWCDGITAVLPLKPLPGINSPRVHGEGVGLPVLMHQPKSAQAADKFIPPNGRLFPATLTAEFTAGRAVTLTFHHTRNVRTARLRGREQPLAYDVSAAISAAMDPSYFSKYSLRGLLRPESQIGDIGIYTPEPYDPSKIPIVLIHGIESAPHIWANVMNEIAADPGLQRRCQVWYFLYPTGISIQGAAARMRASLIAARDYYDPRHRHPGMNHIALVGHSMGGLLSKMQIMDSGEDLHRAFWTKPLEQLPLSKEASGLVQRTLHFQHLPFVTRAVFITTPHRGSKVVEFSPLRMIFKLIRPVGIVAGLVREMSSVASALVNPDLHRFQTFGARSSEGLSPLHPMLAALNRRPLLAKYDTIIAVFPPMSHNKPLEESTDGVVSYQSAWMPAAESTATITGFHICIPSPALAEKLLPILRRHTAASRP